MNALRVSLATVTRSTRSPCNSKSSLSMDTDRSSATAMSMPLALRGALPTAHWGRAIPTISSANPSHRAAKRTRLARVRFIWRMPFTRVRLE